MMIGIKDIFKMIGTSVVSFCAIFVCTLFLNYNMDLEEIKDQITQEQVRVFYDAMVMTIKVVCIVSGGCLLLTSVIMLFFYITHFIDTHKKELGILKALGYSNWKIASGFWKFGLGILSGTMLGYASSHLLMPLFYRVQNEEGRLPDFTVHIHWILMVYLVVLPTVFFSILSVIYSYVKLQIPVLDLIREKTKCRVRIIKKNTNLPFLQELRKNTVRQRRTLIFFIGFAAFCYADMVQMSFSMDDLANKIFVYMVLVIGFVLAFVSLLLAITTLIHANTKTIAMMRVFGYNFRDCSRAILEGYRPIAYIGFAIGTIYQYAIMKIVVYIVFQNVENVPEYNFNIKAFVITLLTFAVVYEFFMFFFSRRIKNISMKEIMLE